MIKLLGQIALIGIVLTTLSSCQSVNTVRVQHIQETDATKQNVLIYCVGTENCEFERFDSIQIIDADHHLLTNEAIKKGIVRLQAKALNQPNALYLSVPSGQHELVIRFYPISKDRAETLHVVHQFNAQQRYVFKMYRDRMKHNGNLLNVSAPDPLCVDLQHNKKTIRRFCRPYDVLTGLGEFVEQKI